MSSTMNSMNSSGQSSGVSMAPAQRYEKLIKQISALQEDLSKTVGMCHTLRSQNETLKVNYEKLREEHVRLRSSFQDAQTQCVEMANSKEAAEQQHEELIHGLRQQLEEQAHHFEGLRAQLAPPRDLDMLRIKIQGELQVPHQQRVGELEGEIEKYRSSYFTMRREHGLLKTEFEQVPMGAQPAPPAQRAAWSRCVVPRHHTTHRMHHGHCRKP